MHFKILTLIVVKTELALIYAVLQNTNIYLIRAYDVRIF